ncbi:DUF4178 domain-containing protein [Botryobacter ruber]|uniref:DUF4178 domain-containing protein n=1 Tax=Botryobacter ruber TaxID=2171629 RepID=UPI000E0BFBEA|nr:DUF4178 domain-containing protein [Botryobacter ruber]
MIGFEVKDKEKLPEPAVVKCPNCRNNITFITHAQASFVGCGSCHKFFETRGSGKGLSALKFFDVRKQVKPIIPIGAKGLLKEKLYAVVGFAKYKEVKAAYFWQEYVLWSPIHGYALLAEYDGHWNYFQFISDYSHGKAHHGSFDYNGHHYNLYNRYRSEVQYAEGEFFWDIRDDQVQYAEYIAPPYTITRILGNKELSWLLGEYIQPEDVKAAFNLGEDMPPQSGIGASEPFSTSVSFETLKPIAIAAACILLLLQVLFAMSSKEVQLNSNSYTLSDTGLGTALPSMAGPTFTLQETMLGKSSLEFKLQAPVVNNWFALGVTLVNTQSRREYDFEMGVEYYAGYTDGENWSEGSTRQDKIISALPAGTYHVILQPYRENFSSVNSFTLAVVQDVPIWSNFWVALGLLITFPAVQWFRSYTFEKRRWMNSDFTPYT